MATLATEESSTKDPTMSRTGLEVYQEALDRFSKDTNEDLTIYSEIPERCKTATCYLGIDEAGRGPVLGPMVYAIFASVEDEDKIKGKKEAGVSLSQIENCPPVLIDTIKKLNDSKQITAEIREEIFAQFSELDYIAFGIKIIAPRQISSKCFRRQKVSLNDVSHNAAMELVQGMMDRGVKIGKVYVDTVGPMDKYQTKLEIKFPELRFKVDKKADSKYKPVSAASICAKVTRDATLKEWMEPRGLANRVALEKGAGWGSGYPGDDVTKKFLRRNIDPLFGFPNIVRDSWSTAADLLDKRAIKIKWEMEETEAPAPKISKFFSKKPQGNDENKDSLAELPVTFLKRKSQFFSYRNLSQTTDLPKGLGFFN